MTKTNIPTFFSLSYYLYATSLSSSVWMWMACRNESCRYH